MVEVLEKVRKLGLNRWLAAAAGVLLVLCIIQLIRWTGARNLGKDLIRASLRQATALERSDVKDLEQYKPIIEKYHLGKKKKPPGLPKLFGILGESALFGNSPKDIKPYAVDAELPGGWKLVEISLGSVELEKDGEKKTITVFPELAAKPGPPVPQPPPGKAPPTAKAPPPEAKPAEARVERPPEPGGEAGLPAPDEGIAIESGEIRARKATEEAEQLGRIARERMIRERTTSGSRPEP